MDKLERGRALFLEGIAHYQAGRLEAAGQAFAAALALVPGRPSILTNLGAVRLKQGRAQEAVPLLQQALAQEPDNLEALGHCATALAELGQPAPALDLFDRALALDARPAALWTLRGNVLRELGRLEDAAASFRAALERGGDAEMNRYFLAGSAGDAAPAHPPRQYVQALFDGYADGFDAHLQQVLKYDAPQRLLQPLEAAGRKAEAALDLGCGTGLCGPWLRRMARRVVGVDLSPSMLARARASGHYDALEQADVADYLGGAGAAFDLVVAADVFIYVGALEEVFARLAARMPAGGVFCFSVEEAQGEGFALRPSLRYAHSEAYLRGLAAAHGFRVEALERGAVREDQGAPIPGIFARLVRA
jgi:predicted TPR repeat methyltransferase